VLLFALQDGTLYNVYMSNRAVSTGNKCYVMACAPSAAAIVIAQPRASTTSTTTTTYTTTSGGSSSYKTGMSGYSSGGSSASTGKSGDMMSGHPFFGRKLAAAYSRILGKGRKLAGTDVIQKIDFFIMGKGKMGGTYTVAAPTAQMQPAAVTSTITTADCFAVCGGMMSGTQSVVIQQGGN
jgi:hypothetical protein